MRRPALLSAVALGLVLSPGVVRAQAADSAAIARELDAVYARFTEGYARADAGFVAALYSEDAYYLQPDADMVRGRDAIAEIFARFLDPFRRRGGPGPGIGFEIVERRIGADMAWDVGYYDIGANGRDGKFVVLWRREADGAWRIHTDAYSGVHP